MMKNKFLAGFLVCLFAVLCVAATNVYNYQLTTVCSSLSILRAEADEDAANFATALNLTTSGNYANKGTGISLKLTTDVTSSITNGAEITICGGDAANDTLSFTIVGYASANGPAQVLIDGTATLGTQAVVVYPQGGTATSKFWADTIAITNNHLPADGWEVVDSGNNHVARLVGDLTGLEYIVAYVYNADGSSTEAEAVTFYIRGY